MKFAEIAILLREIVDRCPGLDGSTITLIPQKAMYPLFKGHHIVIKAVFTQESLTADVSGVKTAVDNVPGQISTPIWIAVVLALIAAIAAIVCLIQMRRKIAG